MDDEEEEGIGTSLAMPTDDGEVIGMDSCNDGSCHLMDE